MGSTESQPTCSRCKQVVDETQSSVFVCVLCPPRVSPCMRVVTGSSLEDAKAYRDLRKHTHNVQNRMKRECKEQ
jgi:hypothetical protein